MTYRGWFALDGVEFANSARVAAHLGKQVPQNDAQVFTPAGRSSPGDCNPPAVDDGLAPITGGVEVRENLYTPPNGAERVSPGLATIDQCWEHPPMCGCRLNVVVDDSWSGMQELLEQPPYRPELAPWHNAQYPESGEFVGVWVTKVDGLDVTPISRKVTEMTGSGGVAGRARDTARVITFEAVLVACTSAGLQYGLGWLSCQLRATNDADGSVLEYLAAHPGGSAVDPSSLWREAHGVVLTSAPEVGESSGGGRDQQATMYRVSWEMTAASPYAFRPGSTVIVDWDSVTLQPVNWVHDAGCERPESCADMPVLFSTNCVPELLPEVTSPPPVCGGCLPVGGLESFKFHLPTLSAPERCRSSAVSVTIHNTGTEPLSLQGFFRPTPEDTRCEDTWFPLQINGLVAGATIHLDAITGRFHAVYDGLKRRPVGVVGTPTGAPWRPAMINRFEEWDFFAQTVPGAVFEIELTLHDREP